MTWTRRVRQCTGGSGPSDATRASSATYGPELDLQRGGPARADTKTGVPKKAPLPRVAVEALKALLSYGPTGNGLRRARFTRASVAGE